MIDDLNLNYQTGLQYSLIDSNLTPGKPYWYSVTSFSIPGFVSQATVSTNYVDSLLQLSDPYESPLAENATPLTIGRNATLFRAYPNPFNSSTKIVYDLPAME